MIRVANPSYWTLGRMPLWAVVCPSSTWTSPGNNTDALSAL
nr:MAG TPA: hypothetical protein [Caudoviricetes sp.]